MSCKPSPIQDTSCCDCSICCAKHIFRSGPYDAPAGEARRAEALAAILAKQQGAAASVKEAAERRRQAEAERQAQLAERLRRKQEAKVSQRLVSGCIE